MSIELSGKSRHILFISLVIIKDLTKRGIYPDLVKYFIAQGHHVTILSPVERREGGKSEIIEGEGYTNVRYKTLNNTKTNRFEKLLSTFLIDGYIKRAVRRKVKGPIDILVTATPPITLTSTISYIKEKYNVKSYLLLKDIFPDNIADLEMISRKNILFKYFKRKEKYLYSLCDHIGCMSPANLDYLKSNHPDIPLEKIEVNPNTIDPIEVAKDEFVRASLRKKYGVQDDARVFFYGGNLGKPQMIDFLIEMIEANANKANIHFFVIGTGTDFYKLDKWKKSNNIHNFTLLSFVPKAQYDQIANIADIGIVLLDRRFIIPNFPNRILSYMENSLPVLLATDVNTDISTISLENGFGLWAESGDLNRVNIVINNFAEMSEMELAKMGNAGRRCLLENFHISKTGNLILDKI